MDDSLSLAALMILRVLGKVLLMAFFQEFCQRLSCLSVPLAGAAPLGSCLTLQLLPPLILERPPPSQMKGIIVWSPLEVQCVSDMVGGGELQGWVS